MTVAVDAIFEDGVLKPLNPIELAEHQKVHLIVETNAATPTRRPLGAIAMLGFVRRFRPETRTTAEWIAELRAGEDE